MIDEKKLIEELEAMPLIRGNYDNENANHHFINGVESWHEIVMNKIKEQPKIGVPDICFGKWIPIEEEELPEVEVFLLRCLWRNDDWIY